MTREEVKRYIELHGDAQTVIDTIKEMRAEGIPVTEQALDERLSQSEPVEVSQVTERMKKPSFFKVAGIAFGIGSLVGLLSIAVFCIM